VGGFETSPGRDARGLFVGWVRRGVLARRGGFVARVLRGSRGARGARGRAEADEGGGGLARGLGRGAGGRDEVRERAHGEVARFERLELGASGHEGLETCERVLRRGRFEPFEEREEVEAVLLSEIGEREPRVEEVAEKDERVEG
jgi:hypothetical protein